MKKLLFLALVLIMAFVLAAPALAAAVPAGFTGGTVVNIDKNGYDSFAGKEITANNSSTVFDNFSFVADNKTLNAWYINVTDDISGTLEVAYKVGSSYSIVTFAINGAGKYYIADSRGSNGANMVKIGAFVKNDVVKKPLYVAAGVAWVSLNYREFYVGDPIDYSAFWVEGNEKYPGFYQPRVGIYYLVYQDIDGNLKTLLEPDIFPDTVFDPPQGAILDHPGRTDITLTYKGIAFSTDYNDYYNFVINDPDYDPALHEGITLEEYINSLFLGLLSDEGFVTFHTWVNVKEPVAHVHNYVREDEVDLNSGMPQFKYVCECGDEYFVPAYFLEIYGPGSIWGEWTGYVADGDSLTFDNIYEDRFFVYVSDKQYGNQVSPTGYFGLQDGVPYTGCAFDNNGDFSDWYYLEWDGVDTLTIKFIFAG